MRRRQGKKQSIKINGWHERNRTLTMILTKRKAGSRRPMNAIQQRVRILKKLVPNGKSMGLDGLFRETADYITGLQMRVKVMQIMVRLLSKSDEE